MEKQIYTIKHYNPIRIDVRSLMEEKTLPEMHLHVPPIPVSRLLINGIKVILKK